MGLPSSPSTPGAARDDTTGQVAPYPTAERCPRQLPEPGLYPAGGVALLLCAGFQGVLSLRTDQLVRLPVAPGQTVSGALGRYWVLVAGDGASYRYLNWRAGKQRAASLTSEGIETLDPDTTDLRPLRTLVGGNTMLGRQDRRLVSFGYRRVRTLRLKLGKRTVTLARHCGPSGCRSVQYVAGAVTWAQGSTVHVYVVQTGRHLAWAPTPRQARLLAYTGGVGPVPTVTHTARRVYAYWKRTRATLPPNVPRGYVSYEARLPRR